MTNHRERVTQLINMIVDVLLYIITLGFSHKYQKRLRIYEPLDPDDDVKGAVFALLAASYATLSKNGTAGPGFASHPPVQNQGSESRKPPEGGQLRNPHRTRQGAEWDKLSTATSVITATSAAALAIPGLAGTGSYWMVNACFCVALGLSLEGLVLVNYMNVIARGVSDKTIGTLAKGRFRVFGLIGILARLPALMMALPMILFTYSSLYLLAGTVIMIIKSPQSRTEPLPNPYYWLPLVPIGFGFTCMCGVVLICEAGAYAEARETSKNDLEADPPAFTMPFSGTAFAVPVPETAFAIPVPGTAFTMLIPRTEVAMPVPETVVRPSQGSTGPGGAVRSRSQHERASN